MITPEFLSIQFPKGIYGETRVTKVAVYRGPSGLYLYIYTSSSSFSLILVDTYMASDE